MKHENRLNGQGKIMALPPHIAAQLAEAKAAEEAAKVPVELRVIREVNKARLQVREFLVEVNDAIDHADGDTLRRLVEYRVRLESARGDLGKMHAKALAAMAPMIEDAVRDNTNVCIELMKKLDEK